MKINVGSPVITPADKAGTSTRKDSPAPNQGTNSLENLPTSAIRQNLQASSDVDVDKVAQVREAIARGELSLDPEVLAEAVVDMHNR